MSQKAKYFSVLLVLVVILGVKFAGNRVITTENEPTETVMEASVVPWNLQSYVNEANSIVEGTVGSISDETNGNRGADATVQVSKVLKGDTNVKSMTIYMFNSPNATQTTTEDDGSLKTGEKVLLFLAVDSEGKTIVYAGSNGKFLIDANDKATSGSVTQEPLAILEQEITKVLN